MIALLQRVSQAQVTVAGAVTGAIERGILLFLGVEREDTEARARRLVERVLSYRIFPDADGKMNLSVQDIGGGVLVVSQFTLVADTRKGTRPGFSAGADPARGEALYRYFVEFLSSHHQSVATGRFGADMQVALVNDGPVTFTLHG